MTEKEKLLKDLADKSEKEVEELNSMIKEKVNELSGLISEEGAVYIIANELGVRLDADKPKREVNLKKIEEITIPKEPVSLVCKVIRKYDIVNFSSKNGEGSVQSLLVGDDTGITRVVFWNDKTEVLENIHQGDIIKVINAYTRENNQNPDRIEVHFGQYSDIEVNPEGVEVELKDFDSEKFEVSNKNISDIEQGDKNLKISGLITDFEIPRFYLGCPECFKKVMQDDDIHKCGVHGEVEPLKIPIVNLKVDDSTGTIDIVGFRDRAENITSLNSEDIINLTQDIDKYRDYSKKIIGSKIEFIGNHSVNNMTGDSQILVNQILNVEFKDIDEIAKDEVKKENKNLSDDEKYENDKKNKEDDLDIEEIDIDDDLL